MNLIFLKKFTKIIVVFINSSNVPAQISSREYIKLKDVVNDNQTSDKKYKACQITCLCYLTGFF